jgi:hypothetical protein
MSTRKPLGKDQKNKIEREGWCMKERERERSHVVVVVSKIFKEKEGTPCSSLVFGAHSSI